jgi:hypothetical protein
VLDVGPLEQPDRPAAEPGVEDADDRVIGVRVRVVEESFFLAASRRRSRPGDGDASFANALTGRPPR